MSASPPEDSKPLDAAHARTDADIPRAKKVRPSPSPISARRPDRAPPDHHARGSASSRGGPGTVWDEARDVCALARRRRGGARAGQRIPCEEAARRTTQQPGRGGQRAGSGAGTPCARDSQRCATPFRTRTQPASTHRPVFLGRRKVTLPDFSRRSLLCSSRSARQP